MNMLEVETLHMLEYELYVEPNEYLQVSLSRFFYGPATMMIDDRAIEKGLLRTLVC